MADDASYEHESSSWISAHSSLLHPVEESKSGHERRQGSQSAASEVGRPEAAAAGEDSHADDLSIWKQQRDAASLAHRAVDTRDAGWAQVPIV